ncbi:MAG TPA: malonyl-ACP O-methyltransferase BioC [Burkholderiales bacterium]|nr:malonyl-ACP O-methyltransferase BioC [Burkholderiales bacterium]
MSGQLDKRQVRRAFERAASTYDRAAVLQREVCNRVLERLALMKLTPRVVLDAGCGTGYAAAPLARRFPRAALIELDIAEPMVRAAGASRRWWERLLPGQAKRLTVCADIEHLPLRSGSCDLVWSNLVLQWAPDLQAMLRELQRVLAPGGLLMFSTFGPDTLQELRAAFARVDSREHVNRFVDMHDIGDMLIGSGLADPVMDMEHFTLTYPQVRDLMRELKALGAHNASRDRARGLTGRRTLARVEEHYARLRDGDGRLPATFEVVYGHAWKPRPKTGPGGRPVIDIKVQGDG